MLKHSLTLLLLLTFGLLPSSALAAPRPLPDFEVTTLDGRAIKSRRFSSRERWLLVYVEPGCRPCEEVYRVFNRETPLGELPQKVAIVVGGRTVEEVKWLAERYPWIPQDCWYADPARNANAAMRRRGAPVVFGIKTNMIEWSVGGSLSDEGKFESVLLTWIEG